MSTLQTFEVYWNGAGPAALVRASCRQDALDLARVELSRESGIDPDVLDLVTGDSLEETLDGFEAGLRSLSQAGQAEELLLSVPAGSPEGVYPHPECW